MNRPSRIIAALSLLLAAHAAASPAEALRIKKSWSVASEKWGLESRTAITPEQKAKAMAQRPDATPYAKDMWKQIGNSLDQDWTLEPAAWFLRITPGLHFTNDDGVILPTFARQDATIRKAVETFHVKSPKLTPMCMALATGQNPRSLSVLEKILKTNPDKKVQGVAALAAAIVLKTLGDDPEIMRKRLSHLRTAIIQSSKVEIEGSTVADIAENELYIINNLTKGRPAPDLHGIDSSGRAIKLSNYKGKVILLLFWGSQMQEADRVIEMTSRMAAKFRGRPAVIIGVNYDSLKELRKLEGAAGSQITWASFSDPTNKLSEQYRVHSWPLAYVLDVDLKIHYAGAQGSFAELTVEALLSEK